MTVNFYESGFCILSIADMLPTPEIEDRVMLNSKAYFVQDRQFKFTKNKFELDIFLECIS